VGGCNVRSNELGAGIQQRFLASCQTQG
jgi:hypothetical protein